MHGTYVEDKRVPSHERHRLNDNDLVKFGNEVTRGPGTCLPIPLSGKKLGQGKGSDFSPSTESFPPLHLVVRYSWVDDRYSARFVSHFSYANAVSDSLGRSQPTTRISQVELPPNTFQVPDYDDEDDEEDDDISFVQETVLKPKLEVVLPPPRPVQPYLKVAISEQPGQGMHCTPANPVPPPPSFTSSPLPWSSDRMAHQSSQAAHLLIAASGPSGLSEAELQSDRLAMNLDESITPSPGRSASTDLQSPAKTSSTPPTSSSSKESDKQSSVKLDVCDTHQTLTGPPVLEKRAMVVDEDLTQSESDSDEAYSPDLMVDDSEDGQRHDVLTDHRSDSYEEALIVAENNGTKAARLTEDSTNSESSRSEFSDDIGMERDEDFFIHSENKMPGTTDPLLNNAFNDYDKTPAQQEPIPYNMRPGNFTMHATRLSLPPGSSNRAPSPSDAAMAKSCDISSGSGIPGGAYPYANSHPWSNLMRSAAYNTNWPCTVDGRPHAPYDDRFDGFHYAYGASCAPGQFTSDSFRTCPSQTTMLPNQSFNPANSGTKQIERPNGTERPHQQSQPPPVSLVDTPKNGPHEVTHLPHHAPKSASKVSIDSIVDRVPDESLSSPNNKLKRKADDVTRDNIAEAANGSLPNITQAEDIQPSTRPPHSKIVSVAQVKAIQSVPTASGNAEERPAKRARTGKESGKPGFGTLAAAALAGAVVGGVGVVAALVSLPQDFFV